MRRYCEGDEVVDFFGDRGDTFFANFDGEGPVTSFELFDVVENVLGFEFCLAGDSSSGCNVDEFL